MGFEQKHVYAVLVILLTVLVLALRLLVTYQVAEPSYTSYFTLTQAESIRETGLPRYHDPYSYGGRTYAFNPAYYYLAALATIVMPETAAVKFLPNLLMVALIPLAYLLSLHFTKNRPSSFLAACFAGFSPALFTTGLNDASSIALALPLLAATLYAILRLDERPLTGLVLITLLALVTPLVWIIVAALAGYLIILAAEKLKPGPAPFEALLFTFLLASWYTLITYKEALFRHGVTLLAHSLPQRVSAISFGDFTTLEVIYAVGVIPLVLGCLALYHASFEQRSRKTFLIAAFGASAIVAGLARLLPLQTTLILLSLAFVLLSAQGLNVLLLSLRKTRFEAATAGILFFLLVGFLLTSLLPSIVAGVYPGSSPTPNEREAMHWLRTQTPEQSLLMASPKAGFLLNHEARRAYVADENYLLVNNPDGILADIDEAYMTPRTVAVVERLERYGVTHVLLGPAEHERYPLLGAVIKDKTCFPIVYQDPKVLILRLNCTLKSGGER